MATALNISQIQTAKALIEKDLLVIASSITNAQFEELGINIITGIEHEQKRYLNVGNNSIARAYFPGSIRKATVGTIIERSLVVKRMVARTSDNISQYAEVEPVSVIGISSNGVLTAPITQQNMELMAAGIQEQVFYNFFHGVRPANATEAASAGPLSLYDGIFKHVQAQISDGSISVANKNLIEMSAVDLTTNTDAAKIAAYEAFDAAFLSLDPKLQKAKQLYVAMSPEFADYVVQGAALKFHGSGQIVIMQANEGQEMPIFGRKNISLKPTDSIGTGQTMIFYTPGVMDFGSDLTVGGEVKDANITCALNGDDTNIVDYQFNLSAGTRLFNFLSSNFAIALLATTTGEGAQATTSYTFNNPPVLEREGIIA